MHDSEDVSSEDLAVWVLIIRGKINTHAVASG